MTFMPENALVWCEIPVKELKKAMIFYDAVFGFETKLDETGANAVAFIPTKTPSGVAGHIYEGTPAAKGSGPTLHMAVPGTVEEAADRCWTAGGTVIGPIIEIPPGRFQYIQDPDGNSVGLFEAKG